MHIIRESPSGELTQMQSEALILIQSAALTAKRLEQTVDSDNYKTARAKFEAYATMATIFGISPVVIVKARLEGEKQFATAQKTVSGKE